MTAARVRTRPHQATRRAVQAALPVVVLCCLLPVVVTAAWRKAAGVPGWLPDTFPNPNTNPQACGRAGVARSSVCDPDGVLSKESADVVEGLINKIAEGEAPYVRVPCGDAGPQGFQVCVGGGGRGEGRFVPCEAWSRKQRAPPVGSRRARLMPRLPGLSSLCRWPWP